MGCGGVVRASVSSTGVQMRLRGSEVHRAGVNSCLASGLVAGRGDAMMVLNAGIALLGICRARASPGWRDAVISQTQVDCSSTSRKQIHHNHAITATTTATPTITLTHSSKINFTAESKINLSFLHSLPPSLPPSLATTVSTLSSSPTSPSPPPLHSVPPSL
ncbi:hypothetical protein E2C01_039835 [Portunus trituberculatus]|uniref:Uncharacterized protein n=1 Tax=Portunus trituberculatus TaxID=210409 RepID=A0A5B7FKU5_PORTR|nr:hypothetical protein [Portunus trituberculatus]